MIRRPPRSTLDRSSAASDVYKRQDLDTPVEEMEDAVLASLLNGMDEPLRVSSNVGLSDRTVPVSYTHLRAHETVLDLVCRLLLEKKKHLTTHKLYY